FRGTRARRGGGHFSQTPSGLSLPLAPRTCPSLPGPLTGRIAKQFHVSFQQIDGMIPLHDGTALGEPDVDTKSYASLMVCFIKNRRYYARPVLRKDLCEVLRGF